MSGGTTNKQATKQTDEELLADLGYKQEFRRAFTPLEASPLVSSLLTSTTGYTDLYGRFSVSHFQS